MNDFVVKVYTPEISKLVQEIAFEHDYEWNVQGKEVKHLYSPYLRFYNNKEISMGSYENFYREGRYGKIMSLDEFFEKFRKSPIKVGDYIVHFVKGGIKIGCQFVSKSEVEEIYNKLFPKHLCECPYCLEHFEINFLD